MDSAALQKQAIGSGAAAPGNIRPDQAKQDEKLRKACASFESFMTYYMLKTMRKSVPQNGLFGNMPGKDTFNMMLDQKIAEKVAERKGGSLGLQKILYDQLSAGGRNRVKKTGSADGPKTAAANAKN